ncbi:hypothetical protein LMG31841_03503 [Paraburkholderia saeva]|uniref:Uncharacterized protein n=2 Tax=Paraburkholderia saeva TaxID=2777537 RepID=A0A9N8RYA6_9BURK|nr:hypothetical protein LMG31841_03503 [Paraburkholderia saeva]
MYYCIFIQYQRCNMALPQFDPPAYDELQSWWRQYRNKDIRRLILEVQAQRYAVAELRMLVEVACRRAEEDTPDPDRRRDLLRALRRRLQEEIQRVGRIYAPVEMSEETKRKMRAPLPRR